MAKKKKKVEKPAREMTRRQLSHFQRQKRRQRIIFLSGVSIIAAIVLIVLVGWLVGEFIPMHKTLIQVGDSSFNTGYYIDMMKLSAANEPPERMQVVASNTARQIEQMALIELGAAKLGIKLSDEEAEKIVKEAGLPVNDATLDYVRSQMLQERLVKNHFDTQVPESDKQVHIMTMLLESQRQADDIRSRLLSGDNFTALSEEFALNYYSKEVNKGDFGWHPETILLEMLGSSVPVDYAFGSEPGTLSQPLLDEEMYKQVGYWLIRVLEQQYEEEAQVQAIFSASEEEAESLKARLEAGEDLAALAEEYSHYSPSKEQGGELGLVTPQEISDAFDAYVFGPEMEIGVWSEPVRDDTYWSQGGYWLVKVVDKADDRELSKEDRDRLISAAFEDWASGLWIEYAAEIDESGLDAEVQQLVIDRVSEDLG